MSRSKVLAVPRKKRIALTAYSSESPAGGRNNTQKLTWTRGACRLGTGARGTQQESTSSATHRGGSQGVGWHSMSIGGLRGSRWHDGGGSHALSEAGRGRQWRQGGGGRGVPLRGHDAAGRLEAPRLVGARERGLRPGARPRRRTRLRRARRVRTRACVEALWEWREVIVPRADALARSRRGPGGRRAG